MSNLIVSSSSGTLPLPAPGVDILFRLATEADFPAMDKLQKPFARELGFFPRSWFEGYLKWEGIRVAIDPVTNEVIGYCAFRDKYMKRDELGYVSQLVVRQGLQRKYVGAALLQNVFESVAYGCKLFSCWCAQDLAANKFWESMGFVPLAFRAGSEKKARVHIFWQKRVRANDTATPWWFPSKTDGGAIGEGRIVLPIPPGTHWSEVKAMVLPALSNVEGPALSNVEGPANELSDGRAGCNPAVLLGAPKEAGFHPALQKKSRSAKVVETPSPIRRNGLMYDIPKQGEPLPETMVAKPATPQAVKKPKAKVDPRLVSAARELRDRWLEEVNRSDELVPAGKYLVARSVDDAERPAGEDARVLQVKRVGQLPLIQQAA